MIPEYDSLRRGILNGHLDLRTLGSGQALVGEVEMLREAFWRLMMQVRNAPCLVSHPGELTYECNPAKVCRVCEWRDSVNDFLIDELGLPEGLWVDNRSDLQSIQMRETTDEPRQ
jgi:hypothetical protein